MHVCMHIRRSRQLRSRAPGLVLATRHAVPLACSIKNSWGDWGTNGYGYVERVPNALNGGWCGIQK